MSGNISDEIKRIEEAKLNIKAAINEKGGAITNELLDKYPDAIRALPSGGGEDKWYEVVDGVLIRKGFSTGGTVVIPSELDGQLVKEIGYSLFKSAGLKSYNTIRGDAANLIISEGIEVIGENAFNESQIKQITFPSTLKAIKKHAFNNAEIEYSFNLPNGLTEIGDYSFQAALKTLPDYSLTIPGTVTRIGEKAFSSCNIKELTLLNGVKRIESGAFYLTKVEKLYIPDSVRYIGRNVFQYSSLKEVSIPSTCTYSSESFPFNTKITKREV